MSVQARRILFLIAGNAGHGKDTFARMLREVIEPWCDGVYSTAYAYGIKKILHDNYGTPWELLDGDKDVKETSFIYVGSQKTDLTVRRALQKIGQFHRETFGATCWAASALTRCQHSPSRVSIITDARHPAEEIHWIGEQAIEAGFLPFAVRVRRAAIPVIADHPSESLILAEPDGSFSFLVENDGSLEDLRSMATQVASAAVLLHKTGQKKLKKKDAAFIIRRPDGSTLYEPLTESDASLLCVAPNTVEKVVFDSISGTAVG